MASAKEFGFHDLYNQFFQRHPTLKIDAPCLLSKLEAIIDSREYERVQMESLETSKRKLLFEEILPSKDFKNQKAIIKILKSCNEQQLSTYLERRIDDYETALEEVPALSHQLSATAFENASEAELLRMMKENMTNADRLLSILHAAHKRFVTEPPELRTEMIEAMQGVMEDHANNVRIQTAATGILFSTIQGTDMTNKAKERLVRQLITVMENHNESAGVFDNFAHILYEFDYPESFMVEGARVAAIFMHILDTHMYDPDRKMIRCVMCILAYMPKRMILKDKIALGEMNLIERIMELISGQYVDNVCDQIMETYWIFLCSVTAEAPSNSCRFVQHGGIDLIYRCLTRFPAENNLIVNMISTLNNIVDIDEMKARLMQNEYIILFCRDQLNFAISNLSAELAQARDPIRHQSTLEISYVCASLLSNFLIDGPSAWVTNTFSWENAERSVIDVINFWPLDAMLPFIPSQKLLLSCLKSTPALQVWSVWSLHNLMNIIGPDSFFTYINFENIVELLEKVTLDARSLFLAKELARNILIKVRARKSISNKEDEQQT